VQTDGRFVQALGSSSRPSRRANLGADKSRSFLEILPAVLHPRLELLVVGGQRLEVLAVCLEDAASQTRGMAQRSIKMSLSPLGRGTACPRTGLCILRSFHGRRVVSSHEARLYLSDPVQERKERQARTCQLPLKLSFVGLRVVETAERRGQTAEIAD
jgi:hypothetical protein